MSEWISVKDKLPKDEQKVIFYIQGRDQCFCGFFEKYVKINF